MALTKRDKEDIAAMIELGVRKYFDHYLHDVFPQQVEAAVRAHDDASNAHGGHIASLLRTRWITYGFFVGLGALGGFGVDRLFSLVQ